MNRYSNAPESESESESEILKSTSYSLGGNLPPFERKSQGKLARNQRTSSSKNRSRTGRGGVDHSKRKGGVNWLRAG